MGSEMKKVKLLVYGTAFGHYGDIVEVPAQVAEHMCKMRPHNDGYRENMIRLAMPAEEAEAMEAKKVEVTEAELASMSQAEAEAAGIKNVTQSDPEDIGSVNKMAAEKKKAQQKAKK